MESIINKISITCGLTPEETDQLRKVLNKKLRAKEPPIKHAWREDIEVYRDELKKAYFDYINNAIHIKNRQEYHPNLDIKKTLKKSIEDFWYKPAGWENKKKTKTEVIDWPSTFDNALSQDFNKVYLPKNILPETPKLIKSEPKDNVVIDDREAMINAAAFSYWRNNPEHKDKYTVAQTVDMIKKGEIKVNLSNHIKSVGEIIHGQRPI